MSRRLLPGLYDSIITRATAERLEGGVQPAAREPLDAASAHERLARHFGDELARVLAALRTKERGTERQAALVNELLTALRSRADDEGIRGAEVVVPPSDRSPLELRRKVAINGRLRRIASVVARRCARSPRAGGSTWRTARPGAVAGAGARSR